MTTSAEPVLSYPRALSGILESRTGSREQGRAILLNSSAS